MKGKVYLEDVLLAVQNTSLLSKWAFVFISAVLLAILFFLAVRNSPQEAAWRRWRLQQRRTSGATTPPRSIAHNVNAQLPLSDSKQIHSHKSANSDYISIFPPSRRHTLSDARKGIPSQETTSSLNEDTKVDCSSDANTRTTTPLNDGHVNTKYTVTGFSIEDLENLGDFPSYDALSGVPLPPPYNDFDHTKALPRPYRPFRWAYHQTMGM